jgi:hypothetical protein
MASAVDSGTVPGVACCRGAHGRAWAEAERRGTGRRKEKGRREKKERKTKKEKMRKGEKEKERKEEKKEKKDLEELEEILGKIRSEGKRDFVGFSGFLGAGAISGMVVMARRAGRRDSGKPGIPGEMADRGAVAALGGTTWWPE